MNPSDVKPTKIAFQCALAYSVYYILLTYIMYFLGFDVNSDMSGGMKALVWVLSYVPFLSAILYAQKYHRDQQLEGYITFGRAFSTGFRVALLSGLIIGVFMMLYYKVLNTPAFDAVMSKTESTLLDNPKLNDSQRETALNMTRKWFGPMVLVGTIIGMAIFGSVFSLIGAAVFKKEAPVRIPDEE